MSSFTTPFNVKVHNVKLKDKPFEITRGFEYYSKKYKGLTVKIPIGYRTNFADVPRIFWTIVPPVGRYSKACVVHDWLIYNKEEYKLSMRQINGVFLEAMKVSGVNWVYRILMYLSVEFYWNIGIYVSTFIRKLFRREL